MRKQNLQIDKDGIITLTNRVNLDPVLEHVNQQRIDNPTGWSKDRTLRKVATIPVEVLQQDFDGTMLINAPMGSPEARLALKKFLVKYPEYKVSGGSV